MNKFTEADLDNCWQHHKAYFIDVLNGDYDLDTAREDLRGLISSKYDRRTQLENLIVQEYPASHE